ncbi:MAG: tetratricopeptide repeat protein [Treponema sp.]|jgi:tetratricopeptide (TPR) repeat protein|nr:tetratricopeptide repeat protein [Treponema sp.]
MKNHLKYDDLWDQLRRGYEERGWDETDAIKFLDNRINETSNFLEAYLIRGELYLEMENFQQALDDLEKVIRIDPNIAESYFSRGMIYARLGGNVNKALDDFSKAIELYDAESCVCLEYAEAYVNRGNMYLKLKNYQQAINDCTKAIEELSMDDRVEPYYNRGLAYMKIGEVSKAFDDYNKVIQLDPKNAEAFGKRGLINSGLGNIQEAINDFEEFLRLDPNNTNAKLVRDELEKLKKGDASSFDDSQEILILKKELKFILIGSIIGAIAGGIIAVLFGREGLGLEGLVFLWPLIGCGGSISLVPSFFRMGRDIGGSIDSGKGGIIGGVLGFFLWYFLSGVAGIIWPLIRILINVFKIKKLKRNI